jgi:hypothetical protein
MPGTSYLRETESTICQAQVACEGNYIRLQRQAAGKTICGACEKAVAKKARGNPPLRGSRLYPENSDV